MSAECFLICYSESPGLSHTRVVLESTLLIGSLELSLGGSGSDLNERNTKSDFKARIKPVFEPAKYSLNIPRGCRRTWFPWPLWSMRGIKRRVKRISILGIPVESRYEAGEWGETKAPKTFKTAFRWEIAKWTTIAGIWSPGWSDEKVEEGERKGEMVIWTIIIEAKKKAE